MKNKTKQSNPVGLQIGGATPMTVQAMQKAIIAIINTSAGDSVKIEAVKALSSAFQVNNTVVSGCSFSS